MTDLSKTLNLPKTSFPMKADLIRREPDILKFWEDKHLYEKMLEKTKDQPTFVLHDGPPYANGDVHLGTAFNKVLKDMIVKAAFMQGFHAPFVPGWDCHGMPIEHRVVSEMGDAARAATKMEIRKRCREYALKFVDVQREQFKRLGVFADWKHPYLTLSPEYEAKILEAFGALVENGFVYRGLRPIHWCPNCRTALAEAEVEYDDHESPSVVVSFLVKNKGEKLGSLVSGESVSFLIWTTTPWTLPANVAIAVHPDYEYAKVKFSGDEKKDAVFVMAASLVEDAANKSGTRAEVLSTCKGSELEGVVCEHPFISRDVQVILGDFVTQETGTGCVHIAPGHGSEDYVAGLKYKLPVLSPVGEDGKFTDEAGDRLKGQFVFKANDEIIKILRENEKLFIQENITHSYPHCWRCRKPVLFRAAHQWFFALDEENLRERVLSEIVGVEWIPSWGEDKISHLVQHRPDWCLSRQRSWGIPIPALYCSSCGELFLDTRFIRDIAARVRKIGIDFWFEDSFSVPFTCKKCGGKSFKKEEDILDVWFESGVSFYSVLKQNPQLAFPADIYLEATDQHRGWFQSSLWPSCALEGRAPYHAVITHGLILDENGKKMSKSLGNVITPDQILKQYGADILRLWFSSVDFTSDVRLSKKILDPLAETYRKIRNTLRFALSNLYDFEPHTHKAAYDELEEIDKFILIKLNSLSRQLLSLYEKYAFHSIFQLLRNFCIVDLSSFYFDVLKERLYVSSASSHTRRCAQTVLYEAGRVLTLLAAPVLSFTMEEVWQSLPKKDSDEESVFLMSFPFSETLKDEALEKKWEDIIHLRHDVNKALELARNEKLVSGSLEAGITLYLPESFRKYDAEFSRQVFIVSSVGIQYNNENTGDALKSEHFEDVYVKVRKAAGEKCARCWVVFEDVKEREPHGKICGRCYETLGSVAYENTADDK